MTKNKDIICRFKLRIPSYKKHFVFATILKGGSGDYEVQADGSLRFYTHI
jgi:hypothetical protein